MRATSPSRILSFFQKKEVTVCVCADWSQIEFLRISFKPWKPYNQPSVMADAAFSPFLFPCQNLNLPITAGFPVKKRKEISWGHSISITAGSGWIEIKHTKEKACAKSWQSVFFLRWCLIADVLKWPVKGFIVWVLAIAEYVNSYI